MSLQQVFNSFCAFGAGQTGVAEMDNAKFAKFARDTRLLDKNLTKTDVDLIFTKTKAGPSARKIKYSEFEGKALPQLAAKKGVSVDQLTSMIVSAGGPASSGTVADEGGILEKLTDTSQYTGAHKARFDADGHGMGAAGRVQETAGVSDLSQITRPGMAGNTGFYAGAGGPGAAGSAPLAAPSAIPGTIGSGTGISASLQKAFKSFCAASAGSPGAAGPEMDNARFSKLCHDCKLIGSQMSATHVDLIYTKVKVQGDRKISYAQFERAVYMIGERLFPEKGREGGFEAVASIIVKNAPQGGSGGVKGGAKKPSIFDKLTDTSLYTGAHKARFGSDGHGLGAAGRTHNTAGVSDLSQITRPTL